MRRRKEFILHLERNGLIAGAKDYPTHCNAVEKSFNNVDIDDIIADYNKILTVKDVLLAHGYSVGYMSGFRAYLKFAVEQGILAKPRKIDALAGPVVQYYFDVPAGERDESLRKALENEYPQILRLAKSILGVNNGYIPVYLSSKTPSKTYTFSPKFLDKLRLKLERPKGLIETELPIISEILEMGGYKFNITGRFYQGEKSYIEIYYRNLPKFNTLESAINCLAHEYMHFLEYIHCFKNGVVAFENEKVSEALADFFGFLCSISRGSKSDIQVVQHRYTLWKVLQGSRWPYAYAIRFLKVKGKGVMKFSPNFADYASHGSVNKFVDVYQAIPNPDDAYNKLKE